MLFVPVWDLNPLKSVRFQYVTVGIIAIDVLIYFGLQSDLFFNAPPGLIEALSPTPGHVAPWQSFLAHLPEQYKLVTYMFLHGSALHLLFNMIFLFVFGDNVEDAMGHVRFIVFYLACGVIAALGYSFLTDFPDVPLVGASGAVSGVIGAYLILHPNIRVWVLVPLPKLPFFAAAVFCRCRDRRLDSLSTRQCGLFSVAGRCLVGACRRVFRGRHPRGSHEAAGGAPVRWRDGRINRTTLMSKAERIDTFASAK